MPKKLNFYKFNCDINLRIANAKTTLQLVKPRRDCIKSPEIQKKKLPKNRLYRNDKKNNKTAANF